MRISNIDLKRYIRDKKKEFKKVKREKDFYEAIQMKRKVLIEIEARDMKFLANLIIFQYYNRYTFSLYLDFNN